MNFENLHIAILQIYKTYNITGFPIDCFDILNRMGYQIVRYADLTDKKRMACQKLSKDACLIKDTIYYEHENNEGRIRFSIMHELGHVVLDTDSEDEADIFASNFLAPRAVMHQLKCKCSREVHDIFGLSYQAGQRALEDYQRGVVWDNRKIHKEIRDFFYPQFIERPKLVTEENIVDEDIWTTYFRYNDPDIFFRSQENHHLYNTDYDYHRPTTYKKKTQENTVGYNLLKYYGVNLKGLTNRVY